MSEARALPARVVMSREAALGLAAYAALLAVFFWRQVFTTGILAQGDAFLLFYPMWDFRAAALRQWRLPLWNPITFMGAPFLANSQYGVLYPPNWPLAWLAAPSAVKVSMLAHLLLAAAGARKFGREAAGLGERAAWFAGALFGLGGYVMAHVGQINQLQGLAWLPWAFWAATGLRTRPRAAVGILGAFLALQILAGHTQTFFITTVGVFGYTLLLALLERRPRARALEILALPGLAFCAAAVALVLAAAQVLPTLELTGQSVRAEGLPASEVLSFSLDPRLLGHALLPVYTHPLFSEYQATLGVAGACLSIGGMAVSLRRGEVATRIGIALAGVAALGLFFSLGAFNPIYAALARYAPGFSLFRAPARWLALWAFAGAMLAGIGVQHLGEKNGGPRGAVASAVLVLGLIGLAWLARGLTPGGETGPLPAPTSESAAWLATLAAALALIFLVGKNRAATDLLGGLALAELFAASLIQPFNRLAPREVYYEQRPSVEFLTRQEEGQTPPGRVLAQSRLFYDPSRDGVPLAEIAQSAGLGSQETYQFIVASKYQDVLSHNLALAWGVPTLDGYDGGILPLKNYVLFEEYLLGRPPLTRDGRLRESLDQFPSALPDGRTLSLANAQYLITDQTFDAWEDDVYFDLTHHARLAAGESASARALPEFTADGLGVISFLEGAAELPDGAEVAEIRVTFEDGQTVTFTVRAGTETAEGDYDGANPAHSEATVAGHYWADQQQVNDYITWLRWPGAGRLAGLEVIGTARSGNILIRGLTLVNRAEGTFAPLVISSTGNYRLVVRADVKVYENRSVLPRAFVAPHTEVIPGDVAALERMRQPAFDPTLTVVLAGGEAIGTPTAGGMAQIVEYKAERVVIQADVESLAYLVLTDAWYPGWQATVDGQPATIERADLLFRAVALPAGRHTVEMTYRPRWLWWGIGISLAGVLALCLALSTAGGRRR